MNIRAKVIIGIVVSTILIGACAKENKKPLLSESQKIEIQNDTGNILPQVTTTSSFNDWLDSARTAVTTTTTSKSVTTTTSKPVTTTTSKPVTKRPASNDYLGVGEEFDTQANDPVKFDAGEGFEGTTGQQEASGTSLSPDVKWTDPEMCSIKPWCVK